MGKFLVFVMSSHNTSHDTCSGKEVEGANKIEI